MATIQIADVIVPAAFTQYIIENSVEKTALVQSGIMARNAAIDENLRAGAESFSVPFWKDLPDDEANIASDDPAVNAIPRKISTGKQITRKAFLHSSWSAMNLASELSGSDALKRIQDRVTAYWTRQTQRRLVASLNGVLADNVANDDGDMVLDISGQATNNSFAATHVIDAAATLGDGLRDLTAIAMHSAIYKQALKADLIQTLPDSQGSFIQTFRGLAVLVDDGLPTDGDTFTTVLFGPGAIGYGLSEPRIAAGTEIENLPAAGNGGGQQVLHSRVNLAIHPLGFQWKEASVAAESPSISELAMAANWDRIAERKAIPLAFLITR